MRIEYSLDENDYLAHQLFIASKSERIRKKRRRNRLLFPLVYLVFGILFYFLGNIPLSVSLLIVTIVWFFLYPFWEKDHYVKHYTGFIKENYKENINRPVTIEFTGDTIMAKDSSSESKISTSEVQEIHEVSTTIYMRLKGGHSIILPKKKITDVDYLKIRLKQLAAHLNIKYDVDEKWEWK
jgi:hypothetical protein